MVKLISQVYSIDEKDFEKYSWIPKEIVSVVIDYDKQGVESVYFISKRRRPPENLSKNDLRNWREKEEERHEET